ncbi:CocE/NonD family hydrolase [Streptomyces sp. MUM 203J]|uniref:CocE/NonD family hydrolase n=1 Tax=Streptomyces sp. MUM 203J TaxID=2791990 RepID=UPI001F035C15|nr:CocE/NonD family hydrolase [Streptomyces sp. MUM 203J]MCH0541832.1 CocE/NonD family hydrolase [Streptomyces sp. MUM 203J]
MRDALPEGRATHDTRDVLVPLPDGTSLYARVWRPRTDEPVPALLEYDPGRLTDGTAPRDAQRHPWYADRGYASVRVDVRGHGNSGGRPRPEGDVADAAAVVAWLARQEWCTGRVGAVGLGPGADLALRLAALPPGTAPGLGAVVAVSGSDGHGSGGFGPPVTAVAERLARVARPPDPRYVGEGWRAMWAGRLEGLADDGPPGPEPLAYEDVRVPVLAAGGWYDPERDTVLRLVGHLPRGLVRGILGPWPRCYPDRDVPPGPAIGFLQETLRWWDHHLKGAGNGAMDEPLLRSWTRGWRGDDAWPPPHVAPVTYRLEGAPVPVSSPLHTGLDGGRPVPAGGDADLPPDQRAEDARSVCFDVPVPADGPPVEILGRPAARLAVRADVPAVRLTARLCDVAPDGTSTLVTRGTATLAPGTHEIELGAAGHAFPPGHRVRLAVSSAYWPRLWPLPDAGRGCTLDPADSSLRLPVRAPAPHDAAVGFPGPEQAPPLGVAVPAMLDGGRPPLLVVRDVAREAWRMETDPCAGEHGSLRTYPDGLELTERALETYEIDSSGPSSARVRTEWHVRLHRPDLDPPWNATVDVRSEIVPDGAGLLARTELVCVDRAVEGDEVLFHHTWEKHLPRP